MMDEFERQLVELATKVQGLLPDLKSAADLRIDFAKLQTEFNGHKASINDELDDVHERLKEGDGKIQSYESDIKDLRRRVGTLEKAEDNVNKHIWDVVKMVFSAGIGAVVAYGLFKLTGKAP